MVYVMWDLHKNMNRKVTSLSCKMIYMVFLSCKPLLASLIQVDLK